MLRHLLPVRRVALTNSTPRIASRLFSVYEQPRISILTEIPHQPGALYDILKYFWKYDIDLTHIESRPSKRDSNGFLIFMDFYGQVGDTKTDKLLTELRKQCSNTLILDEKEVPWFPRQINDLDKIANRVLDAGTDLEADHPGFHDKVYRARRSELADIAMNYSQGTPIPHITYTQNEIDTWGAVFDRLSELQEKYACKEYLHSLALMKRYCGYSNNRIPQAQDISDFLMTQTGFRLRPVAGLLSSRDFLSGLAFRVFFSTQYIRHHSKPLYTPEPDICHELLGHAPMFADPDFADFSQEIGLASLGASDEDIEKLAACYWHSVEFGLLKENGEVKAYGAGLLSSFGELEYSCSPDRPAGGTDERPELRPWDPKEAGMTQFPITCYQPIYFVAESLGDAKDKMRNYCEHVKKPFHARYNPLTSTVWVDRAVKFADGI
mmetsp:Transcript_24403/g.35855  ORF Transcript_24403/g.35855 Transcript_24403/m.35855 type:complete len:437 (-) Transcript_24403:146-1456(-)|eukprot:CAMPEP_0185024992 /NCGR_PEP_ID=MMETSP1103-20130426/8125_1 /TAXON_ID=36769 /ORGANISM="Paraphysomonas bandaiensis, Strain Caron Lab Isolate" /LENGTH=436 /DNA_ID=CAMNT_0027558099 /DNA_START=54 /DNA_END=1364 /DNA_ORIENTATION=+